jgi:hypothetical protein
LQQRDLDDIYYASELQDTKTECLKRCPVRLPDTAEELIQLILDPADPSMCTDTMHGPRTLVKVHMLQTQVFKNFTLKNRSKVIFKATNKKGHA